MEVIFLLIVVSIVFVIVIAAALYWSIKSGQFDDMEGKGHQILMDDDDIHEEKNDAKDQ